jgi:hypothetical protein
MPPETSPDTQHIAIGERAGGSSGVEVIMQHMNDEPIPLTAEYPLVPHDVADIIHSMLGN